MLTTISDASGKIIQSLKTEAEIDPGQSYKFDQKYKPIKNPHLWTAEDPYLYRVESYIIRDKNICDAYSHPLWFRMVKSDSKENALLDEPVGTHPDTLVNHSPDSDSAVPPLSGELPVKFRLTGLKNKIPADRGSVVTIIADILDANGDLTELSDCNLKWKVSGPASLIGPQFLDKSSNSVPISNAIRSSGTPGKIHVSVSASGLVSGTFDIVAEAVVADNSIITEPLLQNEGRQAVSGPTLNVRRLDAVPVEINLTNEEIKFENSDKRRYKILIREYMTKNNPLVDTSTVEFSFLTDILAIQLTNSQGKLLAEDYNFSIDHFNNCRLIAGYINSTKLPQLFKDGLRKYYSETIITKGKEKNSGDEMNWLNWIPSGGTVVYVQNDKPESGMKGAVVTKNTGLTEIIATVYPQFFNFSIEAKERALLFTSKVNPYVHSMETRGNEKSGGVSYIAERGKPILIPLLKFISE